MTRASISLTQPNDEWIQAQIDSKEYTSRSDVLNDLVRRSREKERAWIEAKLIAAEKSGFIEETAEEMFENFKKKARELGKL